ncbi:protein FAR1-RELATED SEQUENCE 6-like [Salvia splendens]|uniref:protein FAR1-RELATED SEQUENCE 6-like n=1 Tax=Salvia splendens TaxID=180675 RepID=UPI001C271BEE|nr:protein FAR1-RELATED SEQUENCE 6-like [Salvia splendens]XP_042012396.1 protein FAR1-RELATED SEQUENCE 6-like [Salvia splendens]
MENLFYWDVVLGDESVECFIWMIRTWLTCMLGKHPQVIVTDQSKHLHIAVSEVFPQACHCYCLSYIMLRVPEKLGGLNGFEVIKRRFSKAVFGSLTISEFETFWREMISQHNLRENKWLQALYEDRQSEGEGTTPFFDGYVHKHTSSKEFLDKYDMVLQRKYLKEAMGDVESRNLASELKTGSNFELQLSKRQKAEANEKDVRHYEVLYETTQVEVGCICGLFNFKGYLCRHALSVLSHNGVEEIPSQYILRRWSKDYKRRFLSDGAIGEDSPWEWHEHLLRRSLQVVEEGAQSEDHYEVMMQDMNGQELYMQ